MFKMNKTIRSDIPMYAMQEPRKSLTADKTHIAQKASVGLVDILDIVMWNLKIDIIRNTYTY